MAAETRLARTAIVCRSLPFVFSGERLPAALNSHGAIIVVPTVSIYARALTRSLSLSNTRCTQCSEIIFFIPRSSKAFVAGLEFVEYTFFVPCGGLLRQFCFLFLFVLGFSKKNPVWGLLLYMWKFSWRGEASIFEVCVCWEDLFQNTVLNVIYRGHNKATA